MTLCDYQSKDSSPLNVINIFWSIFNTHFRTPSSIQLRSTHQNHQRSLLYHRHLANYQIYRGTQFNFTHCDYQSKDFSPLNAIKININHLQHTFPHTMKHTLTLYPSKSSEIYIKSQTFQKTLRLLAEHNSIWHFAIYQSKDSSPLNVINIFWSIFNTHFRTPSSIHLRSTHQNPQRSQLSHRHFRKLSDFSRNTIQFDTLRLTNQNTSRL